MADVMADGMADVMADVRANVPDVRADGPAVSPM